MKFTIETFDILIRAFSSIIFLFFITRFIGRKQISQLSFFDYVIGISIGSIAADMATGLEIPYIHGFLAMTIYAFVAIIISFITNKSILMRRFVNGRSYFLMQNGKILNKNLLKVKYDVNDLLAEARYAGYFNINDIDTAVMEASGRISFLAKTNKEPLTKEDIGLNPEQKSTIANVIIDGRIMKLNLRQIGLNEIWLRTELEKKNAPLMIDIILATVECSANSLPNLSVYKKQDRLITDTFMD